MSIKNIRMSNFRGLRNLACDSLGSFTLIGGRNNCGKTSFLEAVEALSAGAFGSIAFRLNRFRNLYSSEWGDIASVFSDCDETGVVEIVGELSGNISRKVTLRIVPRDLSVYTESEREDTRLGRQLLVAAIDTSDGREQSYESSFYWETKRATTGRIPQDAWVASKENRDAVKFVYLSAAMEMEDLTQSLENMIDAKSQDQIVEILRRVDPRVRNLVVNNGMIKADVQGVSTLLPIQLLGGGMGKIMAILLAIGRCADGGCVCVDEIDAGLHYSAYLTMMLAAVGFARRRNVQIFATTHNREFLQRLAEDEEISASLSGSGAFTYLNIVRYDDGAVEALNYDFGQFCEAVGLGVEIR